MIGLFKRPLSISDNSLSPLGGPERGFGRCFVDVTNREKITSATLATKRFLRRLPRNITLETFRYQDEDDYENEI